MASALAARLDSIKEKGGIRARDIAELLNTTPETVSRWQSGRVEPQPDRLDNLLRLEWLVSELSELYPAEEARLWLFSPHKLLKGDRPADRIREGKIQEVLVIISQLRDGAYI